METLKLVFFILGSAAFLGLIIFFIALIFNKDNGIDLEQCQINYLSREVDRLDKKISKEDEETGKKFPLDLYSIDTEIKSFKLSDLKPTEKDVALAFQKQQFEEKEKMYVEKIRQLEKILVDEEIKVIGCVQVTNLKANKLKYEKYKLNLEKSHLQNEVERLKSLLELNERKYVNLLDFVIFKHKNGITTVDIDLKKTRDKIEKLIEESNKKSK